MDRSKIVERVRKLYAMSQASDSSPNEAEIALRRCQSLMDKFGVSFADLETSEFGASAIGRRFRSVPSYVTLLSSAVAILHDCICIESTEIEFRGFSIDAEVAKLSYDYLLDTMERSLRLHKRNGAVASGRSASFDYRVGFAVAVLTRCKKIHTERLDKQKLDQSRCNGQALLVLKRQQVERHCTNDVDGERKRTIRFRSGNAHKVGLADGETVSLHSQIDRDVKSH